LERRRADDEILTAQRSDSLRGCGCAGGEVTTAQDEKGRQERFTKDAARRLPKVEEMV